MKYSKRSVIRPRRKIVRRRKATKSVGKTSRSFAAKVKKVLHRMAENKSWTQFASNQLISAPIIGSTSATSVQPWSLELLPQITQGTGVSNRIGNSVRLVKNRIRGFINLKPYDAIATPYTAPVCVKMFVFSPKTFTNFTGDMGFTNWQQFFRVNNNNTGFIGSLLDMTLEVNTDLYTLHTTRTYQLNNNGTGSGVYQSPSGQFTKSFSIDLIKYVKDLKYDDGNSSRVANKNLILVPICCLGDGSTNPYLVQYQLAEIHYVHDCEYEDL